MRRGLVILTLALCFSSAALGGNWPRFRGPNGTGTVADKDVPLKWSEQENLLWKVRLPGQGNSSPVIWGDRIFLQAATNDGKERQLLCLSTVDGKVLWTRKAPGDMAKTHRKNSLASGTPAVDGERVYTVFWNGAQIALYAYDLNGKELWQFPLGDFTSQHGPGHSPVVVDGKVIVANDQDGVANLVAVDAKTGKQVWRTPRQAFRSCYSTPFVLTQDDGTVELLVASTAGIAGYNLKDGSENWHWTWAFAKSPLRTVASPVAANGMVFANSGDGAGDRHAVAIHLGGKGDVTSSALAWESKKLFSYVPSMLTHGEHLFFVNDNGIAACHVAKTGESLWQQRIGGNVSASPILIDGKIYAVTEDGEVIIFAAGPTYKELAKNQLGEPVMATPAVADNRLYIRGKDHLFCIGKPVKR
jgi:outer membrane protein assembly factor BamB